MSEEHPRDLTALTHLRERPIGVWTGALDGLAPQEAGEHARELEDLGYGSLWFGEAYGREAFTSSALLLAATRQLVIATGIANIYARDAVTGNAATRTLQAAHPGRFIAGWGVSHVPLVETMRGHEYQPPVTAMRAYLERADAAPFLAAGGEPGPARVLAALRPKMLRLSSAAADGAHPYLTTPEHTRRARATIGDAKLLCVELSAVLTDDRETFQRRAHWHLEVYTGLPNYRASWVEQGFDETDFVRGGSERLKEALVAWGDAEAIIARAQAHLEAGADHVVIQALGEHPFDVPAEQWGALASALPSPRPERPLRTPSEGT